MVKFIDPNYLNLFIYISEYSNTMTNSFLTAEIMNCEDLVSMYRTSCERHGTNPLESVITQLKVITRSVFLYKFNAIFLSLRSFFKKT